MTNFALLQTNIAFCDPEANFKRVRELFAQAMAKDPRPDVVVLPEDWSAGFSDEMFHHMEDFVEPEKLPLSRCCGSWPGSTRSGWWAAPSPPSTPTARCATPPSSSTGGGDRG